MNNVRNVSLEKNMSAEQTAQAIQNAIDLVSLAGGGTVNVPAGEWVTQTIFLKSNVELHLLFGCVILGSLVREDYLSVPLAVEAPEFSGVVIYAENADNVSITGPGEIDGRDAAFQGFRPMLLRFVNCNRVLLSGAAFRNAGAWCTHMIHCSSVRILNMTIDSTKNSNTDGFDLDGCSNVVISDCRIRSGDDSVCLKSTLTNPTENVIVKSCIVTSDTAALKLGTSSRAGFRNVVVSDCVFTNCRMGAVKLLMVDGGVLENVNIHDIVMDDVEGPLFIRLGDRGMQFQKAATMNYAEPTLEEAVHSTRPGTLRNVQIHHCSVHISTNAPKRNGMMISGIPGAKIENVLLEQIELELPGGWTEALPDDPPEDPAKYPEQHFFGVLPSSAVFLRHAAGICLRHVHIRFIRKDGRPAFRVVDVKDLKFEDVTVDGKEIRVCDVL